MLPSPPNLSKALLLAGCCKNEQSGPICKSSQNAPSAPLTRPWARNAAAAARARGGGVRGRHEGSSIMLTRNTRRPSRSRPRRAPTTRRGSCVDLHVALHWKTKEGLVRGCSCRGTAGFAHVSCLAEQAKILLAEAEENNLGVGVLDVRWKRWHTCSLCKQQYHGVVACALGWACWKTYVGRRPETD